MPELARIRRAQQILNKTKIDVFMISWVAKSITLWPLKIPTDQDKAKVIEMNRV